VSSATFAGVRAPRRTREEVLRQACAPDLDKWPEPPEPLLKALDQQKLLSLYIQCKRAVEFYVENRTGAYIKKTTGIGITKAKRLFERCAAKNRDGSIPGFYACLPAETEAPATRHARDSRKKPFDPQLAAQGKGLKGVFKELLDKNDGSMRKKLEKFFRTRSLEGRAPVPVLRQSIVFKAFLQLCTDEGIQDDEYPFYLKRKGEWAITNYWKWWNATHAHTAANNQYGADAAKEQAVDLAAAACTELPPLPRPDGFARVELDEHLLHAIGQLTVPSRSGIDVVVGARRVWALVLRDTGSTAVLATCVSYREKYDRNDILRLVRKALKAPGQVQSPSLAKLRYLPGAAFPSEDGFALHRWQVTAFDADASHLSLAEQEDLRTLLGEVENERVGSPTAHPYAESINARIAEFTEMLPSGTGSSPDDPARRDPEKAAERWSINIVHLEEILDVWARNYNATPQKSLDGRTPLQQLKAMQVQGRVFSSAADAFGDFELYKLLPRYEANITFSRSTPKRLGALGVQLFGASYTSRELAANVRLRSAPQLKCTVYVEDDARYAWVVPQAYPDLKFFVKVTNRDLKDFVHSLEWRRLTEAHGTNAVYEAKPASVSTMFDVLESLAELAKNGNQAAAATVSQFSGFMSQAQNGLLHYVSSAEQRRALDEERPSGAATDQTAQPPSAGVGGQPSDTDSAPSTDASLEPPAEAPARPPKAPADPIPLQGQTPHRPLSTNRDPFGLKR
jgi:hypothetical protein